MPLPCAGIEVAAFTTSLVTIAHNVVVGTLGDTSVSQGSGIAIAAGAGHLVYDNTVGLLGDGLTAAGNVSHGIELVGDGISAVVLQGNTVSANGRNGIHLGPGASCSRARP